MNIDNSMDIVNNAKRPNAKYYIDKVFQDFVELSGDRLYGDDPSVIGGIGKLDQIPVTVIGQLRGSSMEERIKYNFSMCKPEGYRKAMRLMQQAEKFKRPVIFFIDTLGAYPGKAAEERGQGHAIAKCLMRSAYLKTPIISILIGHAYSGGALAFCVADVVLALEFSTMGIISPKACTEILRNITPKEDATKMLQMSAKDLTNIGLVDIIVSEPIGGAHTDPLMVSSRIKKTLIESVRNCNKMPIKLLLRRRIKKYENIGKCYLVSY